MCEAWKDSFDQFFADMGPRPSPKHSLDRIDNNGDYEPGNVRWATPKEQARNTSRTRFLTVSGVTKPLTQWAEELGITPQSLGYRIKAGWDIEAVVRRPMSKSEPYIKAIHSKRKRGETSHLAKLTDPDILAIRQAHAHGETFASIARRYEKSPNTIGFIVKRKTWTHI